MPGRASFELPGLPRAAAQSLRPGPLVCLPGLRRSKHQTLPPSPPPFPCCFVTKPEATALASGTGRLQHLLSGRICTGALAGAVQTRWGRAQGAPHHRQPQLAMGSWPPACTTQARATACLSQLPSPPRHSGAEHGRRQFAVPRDPLFLIHPVSEPR